MAPPRWTDSHCHLQEPLHDAARVDQALVRALEAGVERVVCVGTGLETSTAAVELAAGVAARRSAGERLPLLRATAGLHPHDASDGLAPVAAFAAEQADGGLVVGIGECGLDYYYEHSPRDVQRQVFADQVRLAQRLGLALVVHTRDAWDDTAAILEQEGVPDETIIHCFTGGPDEARRCLALGAYLSFSGIVTFANAGEVREAAQLCPLDRLLIETDSPFLAPVPHRGKANEPALVTVVGAAIAALRNETVAELASATHSNAARVFRLPPGDS